MSNDSTSKPLKPSYRIHFPEMDKFLALAKNTKGN